MKIFKSLKLKIKQKTAKEAEKNINILSKAINKPNEGEIVKLGNIKIPHYFTNPNKDKMKRKEEYYKKYGYFKSVIVLNRNDLLVDGYTTYLLAIKNKYKYITILREK